MSKRIYVYTRTDELIEELALRFGMTKAGMVAIAVMRYWEEVTPDEH